MICTEIIDELYWETSTPGRCPRCAGQAVETETTFIRCNALSLPTETTETKTRLYDCESCLLTWDVFNGDETALELMTATHRRIRVRMVAS